MIMFNINFKKPKALMVFGAALVLQALPVAAQDSGKINLKDAVAYSLKNHPSNMTYSNDIRIAKQKSLEALSGYLPQINGTGPLDDNLQRQITVIPAGTLSPTEIKIQLGTQYLTNLYGEV